MDSLRPIASLPIPNITPNAVSTSHPEFKWVRPDALLVEEAYQRDLGDKSIRLIRKIVAGWDWTAMKPPICARRSDGALVVIDGQHTAIAAASHPGIDQIPVMIVAADTVADRATSFVKHNADRIAMTSTQVHFAALAAGDEVALAMRDACQRAGARLLRNPPSAGVFKVGDTMAVVGIRTLTERRGVAFMARVLGILVEAKRAPLASAEIWAVSSLLSEPEWRGTFDSDDLAVLIRTKSAKDWEAHAEVNVRKGLKMPMHKALAIDWFKSVPKRRRAA